MWPHSCRLQASCDRSNRHASRHEQQNKHSYYDALVPQMPVALKGKLLLRMCPACLKTVYKTEPHNQLSHNIYSHRVRYGEETSCFTSKGPCQVHLRSCQQVTPPSQLVFAQIQHIPSLRRSKIQFFSITQSHMCPTNVMLVPFYS